MLVLFFAWWPVKSSVAGMAAPPEERKQILRARVEVLELAMSFASEDPERAIEHLQRALEGIEEFAPEIADNHKLQRTQRFAMLTLASTQIYSGLSSEASATLRALFRVDPPSARELKRFGPALREAASKVQNSMQSLAVGKIAVKCSKPCDVYVNERRLSHLSRLALGEYRIHVRDVAQKRPPLETRVELKRGGEEIKLRFGDRTYAKQKVKKQARDRASQSGVMQPLRYHPPELKPPIPLIDTKPVPQPASRIAPLWLEVTGMVVGGGLAGGGVYLWWLHDQCSKTDVTQYECVEEFRTKPGGIAMLASGGLIFTASVIAALVDYRVQRSKATSANRASKFRGFAFRF